MARIRTVKPDFWTDEKMVELSFESRLFFIGLWNFVDDEGRIQYSPKKLKMLIFPADSVDVPRMIQELSGNGRVVVYAIDGVEYLQVNNFLKHQRIDKRSDSKLPPPPTSAESRRIPPNPAESQRIPTTEWKGMEGSGMEGIKHPSRLNGAFAEFWTAYPRKNSKGRAERTWLKLKPSEQLVQQIIAGVERAKTSADWKREGGRFIPHPATWLNNRGWEDEQGAVVDPRNPGPGKAVM